MKKNKFDALGDFIVENEIYTGDLLKVICGCLESRMKKEGSNQIEYKDHLSGNGYVFDIEIIGASTAMIDNKKLKQAIDGIEKDIASVEKNNSLEPEEIEGIKRGLDDLKNGRFTVHEIETKN